MNTGDKAASWETLRKVWLASGNETAKLNRQKQGQGPGKKHKTHPDMF